MVRAGRTIAEDTPERIMSLTGSSTLEEAFLAISPSFDAQAA
jgi:hypothetical protein